MDNGVDAKKVRGSNEIDQMNRNGWSVTLERLPILGSGLRRVLRSGNPYPPLHPLVRVHVVQARLRRSWHNLITLDLGNLLGADSAASYATEAQSKEVRHGDN
jgi:hypothetical protein